MTGFSEVCLTDSREVDALSRILVIVVMLLSGLSVAGEAYLGAVVSAAGADTTNDTTATPFKVPHGAKLTIYCTAAANICVDTSSACTVLGGANPGVPVASTTLFPTSTRHDTSAPSVSSATAATTGAYLRIVGAGAVTCYVWARQGSE